LSSSQILLSICIPTLNRGSYLFETLKTIGADNNEQVEICIYDGASTDDTEQLVIQASQTIPNIVYKKAQKNGGLDRDLDNSVRMARGKYCWLMSSDDHFVPGAIQEMLAKIESENDIYICNSILCNEKMIPLRQTSYLSSKRERNVFNISSKSQFLEYLSLCSSNNALFCYMSSIVFKRTRWVKNRFNEQFLGTNYAHVSALLSFKDSLCNLEYVNKALIMNRPGNDNFSNGGIEKRYLIDLNGYLKIAEHHFMDDQLTLKKFLSVMQREHKWYRIAKLRSNCESEQSWLEIKQKLLKFGYSKKTLLLCDVLGGNKICMRFLLKINTSFPGSKIIRLFR